jgi:hypothetical protein
MELDQEYSCYFMMCYGIEKLLEASPDEAIQILKRKFAN